MERHQIAENLSIGRMVCNVFLKNGEKFSRKKGWKLILGADNTCVQRHRCVKYHQADRCGCRCIGGRRWGGARVQWQFR